MAQQSSPDINQILSTIRQVESSNDYGAQAKGSSASGAYQFIDSTWQASTKKSGLGTEYARAKDAPPEVQDAVAAFAVRDILNRAGGDVAKVPLVWYTGNPEGRMTEDAIRANQGLTADKYQQKWLSVLGGGATTRQASTQKQAPRTTAQGPKQIGARVASAFNPGDLPSSYTSALALNYLADTDPEGVTMSKVNEMLTEMMEDGGGAAKPAGGKILQQFAQAKSADPFQFVLQQEEPAQPKQRAVPRMPKMFADGGEVDYNQMAEQMTVGTLPTDQKPAGQVFQNIGRDIVRGAQYLPYDLAGAPVDIATMAMRPFGYNVEKPVGGSEYLIEKARQAGIAQAPTGSAAETATRIGMGFVNPAAVARQIPKGIAAIEKGAETLGTGAVRAITGKPEITTEQIYQAMAEPQGIMKLGTPAISRMPGGTFVENPQSRLTQMLSRTAEKAERYAEGDPEKAVAAMEMFTKKAADFYKKRAGSVDDELKQELLSGRIKLPEDMDKVFPKYLLENARKGDISALRDFEQRYDEMLGLEQKLLLPKERTGTAYDINQELRQNIEQGMLYQFKSSPELIPDDLLRKLTNKEPKDVRDRIKENPEYFSVVLEPKIKKIININAETVTPEELATYPSTYAAYQSQRLSPNELEAVKRNQPLMDLNTNYPELFGYDIDLLAKQAGKMSTQELKDINFATFVTRATRLAVKEKTLEAQAEQLTEAVKKNKPIDSKLTLFGTENFLALPEGFSWRKVTDPDATILQSAMMDNSIKGYAKQGTYGPFGNGRKSLESGDVELYVLYNKQNLPVTNVEMVKGLKSGTFSMRQAQGNGPLSGNVVPNDYLPQLKALINRTQPADLPFEVSRELRYIDAPEGFAKGGMVDKPLYDRAQ